MKQQCSYTDKLSDSNRWLTLQGIPNHTTYEHSKSLTWQPFTSSQPKFSPWYPYSRAYPHILAHGCEPAAFDLLTLLALREGGRLVRYTLVQTRRYCKLRSFTAPINTACD